MMKLLFPLFLLLFSPFLYSQPDKLDSLEKLANTSQDTARVQALLELAHAYSRVDTDKAMQIALKAGKESELLDYDRGVALTKMEVASILYNQGKMVEAERLAKHALDLLIPIGTKVEIADLTNLIGLSLMGQSKFYLAEQYFDDALKLYNELMDLSGIAIGLHNLAVISFYEGDYVKSTQYYINSLRLSEHINNRKLINSNLMNLGLVFNVQKDFSKAKQYVFRALKNHVTLGDKMGEANAYTHLGTIYYNSEVYDSSMIYHQKALNTFREVGSSQGIAQAMSNIADILTHNGNYTRAKEYYFESLYRRRENNDFYGMSICYTGLANVNYGLGNTGIAEAYYDSALTISREIGTIWYTGEVYLLIANFQDKLGNWKNAYTAMKRYSELRDTLFETEKLKAVRELNIRYEKEKTEKDLIIQTGKVEILTKQKRLYIVTMSALGIILLMSILLALSWYQRRMISKQKNLELAEKNRQLAETELERSKLLQNQTLAELDFKRRELSHLALHIQQQNEFLESLRNNLKQNNGGNVNREITIELESKLNLGKQRENFEMNIDLINDDFYRKLRERFPNLSENDKKLCAMVRLNLSSKEIAAVLNITSKSVDMNRYRLRKKMQLDTETDLVSFLSNL